jgi:serine/threonine protein kinase
MPLSAGDKLGPYEILTPIGAGGMGEVYKARDTRLGRDVAVKTSKIEFTERFEREARAIAQLNHPHICQIYDVGPNYLVMEYVEGTPLKGPLAETRALEYAGQILSALDHAHRNKITHRDLKPSNILVTRQGVKLLDFGLARFDGGSDSTVTQTGTVLGTPAYMSPEQWDGQRADARSDIYAFGCVLYEMLTGKRASVDRTALRDVAIDTVISNCLAKDPEERWQAASDIQRALALPKTLRAPLSRRWQWAAAAFAGVALFVLWAPWRGDHVVPIPSVRVDLDTGANLSPLNIGTDAILSPDASTMVFVGEGSDGGRRLFVRRLDQSNATELQGTNGAIGPFFAPDG